MRTTIAFILAASFAASSAWAAQTPGEGGNAEPQPGEMTLTDQEKAQLRKMGRQTSQETEQIIQKLDAQRREAASYRKHPNAMQKELMEFVSQLKQHNKLGDEKQFIEAGAALRRKLDWLENNKVRIPVDIGNELSESIIPIFEKSRTYTLAYKLLPIEVAARYGNSRKVKDYLTALLIGSDEESKKQAILELAWSKSLKGDMEIFDALATIYKVEGTKNPVILGAMSRLDRTRALPFLLREIESTTDTMLFQKDSDLLSEYGQPDLLEHVLKRIKDFPKAPAAADNNPTIGIYPELLLAYIKKAEGPRLKLGLDALEQTALALATSYPLLATKLQSQDPESRKAVVDCLGHLVKEGTFANEEALRDLEQHLGKENDAAVRKQIFGMVQEIKKRLNKMP